MSKAVGIDLGTTNSVVAYTSATGVTQVLTGAEGFRIVPSVIYFDRSDGSTIVGDRALQFAVVEPGRCARFFKRGMGEKTFLDNGLQFVVDGKEWRPEELSSLVLKKLKLMAEQSLGEPVRDAVITVPAYFGEPERSATRLAGELAGFKVLRILSEPTAAAIAHGFERSTRNANVLVFDLGGGTFDVTVMRVDGEGEINVLFCGGDRRLGGVDFDNLILARIARDVDAALGVDISDEPYNLFAARQAAEDMKKELSSRTSTRRPIMTGGKPFMFSLTRSDFNEMISDKLVFVQDTIEMTIKSAGVTASEISKVLMVGGSSRIPILQQILQEVTGREPTFSSNLDEDVAVGASILATKLHEPLQSNSAIDLLPMPIDAASHGLGVTVLTDSERGELQNSIIIRPGTPLPAQGSAQLFTVVNGQSEVELVLNEGDEENLDYVRVLGRQMGEFSAPRPAGYPLEARISYDLDQLITAEIYDAESGERLCFIRVRSDGGMTEDQKALSQETLSGLEIQ
jgi:molecular chaperone DnaK